MNVDNAQPEAADQSADRQEAVRPDDGAQPVILNMWQEDMTDRQSPVYDPNMPQPQMGQAYYQQPQPYQPYQYQPTPYQPTPGAGIGRQDRKKSGRRELVMALATVIFGFVMLDCSCWTGRLGLGFACGAVFLPLIALWYLRPHIKRFTAYSAACLAAYIVGCVSLVFSADMIIKAIILICLPMLYSCVLMDCMGMRAWPAGTLRSIADFCHTLFILGFCKIDKGLYTLFHWEKAVKSERMSGFGKALIGLLVALPPAVVLVVLLSSADAAFSGMLENIDLGKLPEKLISLLLTVFLLVVVFSRLISLPSEERKPRGESGKGLDPTIVTFFLLGIALVYTAYLFSQLSYFFSGFMGFLPEEFTYSEYARRGFFELGAVSSINILVVVLVSALTRKQDGRLTLPLRLLSLFVCVFSLILTATEIAKMKLYMDTFGLTRLRILTTLFTVFLGIVFIALIIHVFTLRFPYMKIAVIAGALMIVALNFAGGDRMVADYNVGAYKSGKLSTVDVYTITELGDAAVPSLLELARGDDPDIAKQAKDDLRSRRDMLHDGTWNMINYEFKIGELKDYDFRGYNTVSYQARRLLLENEKSYK